jgi:hypothetical protein
MTKCESGNTELRSLINSQLRLAEPGPAHKKKRGE